MPRFDWVGRDMTMGISCGCLLRSERAGHVERHDHVDLKPDQLGSKRGKAICLSVGGAEIKLDVLPCHIAKLAQPFRRVPS